MTWTNDPERDFARLDAELAEREAKYPDCDCCGSKIYNEYYDCFGKIICEDCMDGMKHYVEDYE